MIDRAGLEIRYTPFGYRGFESLTFRKTDKESCLALFFCVCSEGGKVAELVEAEDEQVGVEASQVATLQAAEAAMP